jgi:hypothetical protein
MHYAKSKSYSLGPTSRIMENDMKHILKNSITENMYGLLECTLVDYATRLRKDYPDRIIRNAAVFASGVPEFARLGFIELAFRTFSFAQSNVRTISRFGLRG